MSIKLLSNEIINKIAAGEVVERPSSVVKELIENSIDAKSKKIIIEVVKGGKELIKVTDEGEGINRDEIELAFKRYSTSKISKIEDLSNITTLGFRGEALHSIAEVAKVKLISRRSEAKLGKLIIIEGGIIKRKEDIGAPVGTTVEVKELFFNTPTRKKFLKSDTIEMAHISKVVIPLSLACLGAGFKLIHNGYEIFNLEATDELLDRVSAFYGFETPSQLLKIDYSYKEISLSGYISKPNYLRNTKDMQLYFINGRWIAQDRIINKAIQDAYRGLIPHNKYAAVFLYINLPNNLIDVNVHPTKQQVRFSCEKTLYEAIIGGIKNALSYKVKGISEVKIKFEKYPVYTKEQEKQKKTEVTQKKQLQVKQREIIPQIKHKKLKVLAQIYNLYILAIDEEALFIIDQHAAHERILYEQLKKEVINRAVRQQELLSARLLNLSIPQMTILKDNIDTFDKLGFKIVPFGKDIFALQAVPIVAKDNPEVIIDIINEMMEIKKDSKAYLEDLFEEALKELSCCCAVKKGEALPEQKLRALVEQLEELNLPCTCPHGRLAVLIWNLSELSANFARQTKKLKNYE